MTEVDDDIEVEVDANGRPRRVRRPPPRMASLLTDDAYTEAMEADARRRPLPPAAKRLHVAASSNYGTFRDEEGGVDYREATDADFMAILQYYARQAAQGTPSPVSGRELEDRFVLAFQRGNILVVFRVSCPDSLVGYVSFNLKLLGPGVLPSATHWYWRMYIETLEVLAGNRFCNIGRYLVDHVVTTYARKKSYGPPAVVLACVPLASCKGFWRKLGFMSLADAPPNTTLLDIYVVPEGMTREYGRVITWFRNVVSM